MKHTKKETEKRGTMIRLSILEKRYARALSLRLPGCVNRDAGSVAYALKYLLHREAERDGVDIESVYAASYR